MSFPIPDLSDGLTQAGRRLLQMISSEAYDPERCSPDDRFISTWPVVEAVHRADPSTSAMDLTAVLLRFAREWVSRYPLAQNQGSFGDIDGEAPAAMRYTGVRVSRWGKSLLRREGIRFPNLLCNGAWAHSGTYLPDDGAEVFEGPLPDHLCDCIPREPIRGGEPLAFLPPNRLGDVSRALLRVLDHPNASLEEILQRLPGPDFPTGAILLNIDDLPAIYRTGAGILKLRARMDLGTRVIDIREIPYGVTKTMVIEQIAGMIQRAELRGISDLRDMSSRTEMKIQVEVKPGTDPGDVRERLLGASTLQRDIPVLMRVDDGKVRQVGILELLADWIERARKDLARCSNSRAKELIRIELERWIEESDPRRTTIGA